MQASIIFCFCLSGLRWLVGRDLNWSRRLVPSNHAKELKAGLMHMETKLMILQVLYLLVGGMQYKQMKEQDVKLALNVQQNC
ncbi:hypothetical protein TNCV_1800811 [Trichonephila clavipes]|nr:hypothetical protein TNCV_1800811 [Trichonephila clavipes]